MKFHSIGIAALAGTLFNSTLIRAGADNDFPKIFNTQVESIPVVPPSEAVKTIKMPPGFNVTLFAGEPDVQQPIGMATDSKGRLWVAENYTYSEMPLNFDPKIRDRIVIFEDADNDGHFDKRTVFWDRAQKLTSVATGFDGVYALCPPNLLFLPDRNHDDVPDGEPEVLLDGFENGSIRHTLANGLKWGPDGWLYGRHGIQATSRVGAPRTPANQRVPINAGIWRFHPVTHRFEVVAEGTTNPWGSDWDENGQLFFINTVIGHLWHVVPGAFFKRMYGEHFNPHLYEYIEQTADHVHWDTKERWDDIRKLGVTETTSQAGGGHAHSGFMIYLGDNWPEQYRNTLFTVNYHGKRLNNDRLERQGSDYRGVHLPDFLTVGDPWFRGIDVLYGPDGGVYMSDWSDIGECHDNDGIHRGSGRIYKIFYGSPNKPRISDVAAMSNDRLIELQGHRNDWYVRQARQVLQERAARGDDMKPTHRSLRAFFEKERDIPQKLRAVWALHATGASDTAFLMPLLRHESEHLRVWGIQLLMDQTERPTTLTSDFARMAAEDQSGLVLSFLASALRRLPLEERWKIAEGLAGHAEFSEDRVLPLMIWYGIEPAVPRFPSEAVSLARRSRIPKLSQFIARRIFEENDLSARDLVVQSLRDAVPEFQATILRGINEALRGIQKSAPPASWAAVGSPLAQSKDGPVQSLAGELNALFGDGQAIESLRAVVADVRSDLSSRRRALQTLLQAKAPKLTGILTPLLGEIDLASDAIRGFAAINEPETGSILLREYPALRSSGAKLEAINTLVSRKEYASKLLASVQRGLIKRQDVGASQIRQLRTLGDREITAAVGAIWPQLDNSPAGKQTQFTRFQKLLSAERLQTASSQRGRAVFQQTCAACHVLFGEGGKIGPDITGGDRRNLDYLLDNIINPSGVVPENYRVSVLEMKDGRVINGIVGTQTAQVLAIQTVSENLFLDRKEIASIRESNLSMMPDGLLDTLNEDQICDLIAYLQSTGPAPGDGK